jgi:hypothetical protein
MKHVWRTPALICVAVFLFAGSSGAATSGLRGLVTKGPTQPVCVAETPCSAPAKHVLVMFSRGSAHRSVTTDVHGRYRIALAPGTWTITVAGARFGYRPRSAVVPAGAVAVRNITIDTGIR